MSKINQGTKGTSAVAKETPPVVQQVLIARLTGEQYKALEAGLPKIDQRCTDPIQAGIALGVQIALAKIREGFSIG